MEGKFQEILDHIGMVANAEATNESKEFFGQKQITQLIRRSAGPPWGKHFLEAAKNWGKSNDMADDLTILEIWRNHN